MREPLHQRLDRNRLIKWLVMLAPPIIWLRDIVFSALEADDLGLSLDMVVREASYKLLVTIALTFLLWLVVWLPRRDPLVRLRGLEGTVDLFLALNGAYPAEDSVSLGTADALERALLLAPGGALRLYHVDTERVDACLISEGGHHRIVITTGLAEALDSGEQAAVIVRLLVSVPDSSGVTSADLLERSVPSAIPAMLGGASGAHERDMRALLTLRNPEPLLSALLKTARTGLTDAAHRRLVDAALGSRSGEDRRLLAAITSSGVVSGYGWLLPDDPAMAQLEFVSWSESPGCLERARLLAEVSGVDGHAQFVDGTVAAARQAPVEPPVASAAAVVAPAAAAVVALERTQEPEEDAPGVCVIIIEPGARVCPACGAEREPDDRFCWLCYAVFATGDSVSAAASDAIEGQADESRASGPGAHPESRGPVSAARRPGSGGAHRVVQASIGARQAFRSVTFVLAGLTLGGVLLSSSLVIGLHTSNQGIGGPPDSPPKVTFQLREDALAEDVDSLVATLQADRRVASCRRKQVAKAWSSPPEYYHYIEVTLSSRSRNADIDDLCEKMERHPSFERVVFSVQGSWAIKDPRDHETLEHPFIALQLIIFFLGFLPVFTAPDGISRPLAALAALAAGVPMAISSGLLLDRTNYFVDGIVIPLLLIGSWLEGALMSALLFALGIAGAAVIIAAQKTGGRQDRDGPAASPVKAEPAQPTPPPL